MRLRGFCAVSAGKMSSLRLAQQLGGRGFAESSIQAGHTAPQTCHWPEQGRGRCGGLSRARPSCWELAGSGSEAEGAPNLQQGLPLAQLRGPCFRKLSRSPPALWSGGRAAWSWQGSLQGGEGGPGRWPALCGCLPLEGVPCRSPFPSAGLPRLQAVLGGIQGLEVPGETHSFALSHLKLSQKQLDSRILSIVCQECAEPLNSGCSLRPAANPGVAVAGTLVAQRSCPSST